MVEFLNQLLKQWNISEGTSLSGWITAMMILFITLAGWFSISFISTRIQKDSPAGLGKLAWSKFRYPLLATIILIDFIVLQRLLTDWTRDYPEISQITTVGVIFCITWLLIRGINLARVIILRQYDLSEKDNLKARKVYTQFRILERIIIFIVILIAVAVALMTFESIKRIGLSLFASAGVAGIIIGFAAQKLLGSILAGFQIALTQPIRIDDVVIVENEWGWIEEITLTYVVVRIWDKRRLIVPTTYFIEKPFQNWTRVSADILGSVFIHTDYRMPVEELRKEFTRILENSDLWDGKTAVMQVTNATETSVEIRALMSAADSPKAWDLRVHVREKLIGFLQKNYPESLPRTRVEMNPPVPEKTKDVR
jgi:small-conductance mechanosensitive channel